MPPPRGSWNPLEGPGDYTTTKTVHNDTYAAINPTKADFTSKTVFINGASRGLGREMALSFAKAGASHIVISARSDLSQVTKDIKLAAKNAGRKEPDVLTLKVEASDPYSVAAAASQIEKTFGKLDVLINNAAVMGSWAKIAESDPDDWWNTVTINLRGPYLMSRACIPLLLKGENKTLANVASVGGLVTGPTLSAYQMSKTAVMRLTDFTAAEYVDQGLTAFCIHPGNILTDMIAGGEGLDDDFKAVFTETPQLCADTLVYLASGTKQQWLNGRYINCTWDMTELEEPEMRKRIVDGGLLKLTLRTP